MVFLKLNHICHFKHFFFRSSHLVKEAILKHVFLELWLCRDHSCLIILEDTAGNNFRLWKPFEAGNASLYCLFLTLFVEHIVGSVIDNEVMTTLVGEVLHFPVSLRAENHLEAALTLGV